MAVSQNQRDLMLAATSPRILPYKIPADMVEGLPESLNLLLKITPSANAFVKTGTIGTTTPTTITLTAEIPSTLIGNVVWTVIAGSGTFSTGGTRNSVCTVTGSTVSGQSITLRATVGGQSAQYTISKFGALAQSDLVNLTNQVTGQLANSNVDGLGALALLNVVNLNTQTVGALNGATQVTNLGALAYANAIAANQIGAGTLAAGVIYAGTINADNITSGTITGRTLQTATSGNRIVVGPIVSSSSSPNILVYSGSTLNARISADDASAVIYANARNGGVALQAENAYPTAATQSRNTSTGPGVWAMNTGTGYGLQATSVSGAAIRAAASGASAHDLLLNGTGMMKLTPRSSFPSAAAVGAGTIIMHTSYGLCFTDGSVWGKLTFTTV